MKVELVVDSITCKICNKFFNNPVVLPCINTVCNEHVIKDQVENKIACYFCKEQHEIPESGLKKNKLASDLIESNIYLNNQEKEIKDKLMDARNELSNSLEEMLRKEKETDLFISDYFSSIKNKIDLNREVLKAKIDEIAEGLIKASNGYEEDCKKNLDTVRTSEIINRNLFERINDEVCAELRNISFNREKVLEQMKTIAQQTNEFKDKIKEFELFKLKLDGYEFKNRTIELKNDCLGEYNLMIDDYEFLSGSSDLSIKVNISVNFSFKKKRVQLTLV